MRKWQKRIDDSTIEKINELYLEYGVKSRVAKELGVSPSSVSKYIQPNYIKKAYRSDVFKEFFSRD